MLTSICDHINAMQCRPFDAWSAGMKDYARMNTNYLLPLYDKLLHDLAVPANCTAHVIEQVHAESNKLARRSYKPITVKDRVARWMKKCLNELRELYPSSEASEMHVSRCEGQYTLSIYSAVERDANSVRSTSSCASCSSAARWQPSTRTSCPSKSSVPPITATDA